MPARKVLGETMRPLPLLPKQAQRLKPTITATFFSWLLYPLFVAKNIRLDPLTHQANLSFAYVNRPLLKRGFSGSISVY